MQAAKLNKQHKKHPNKQQINHNNATNKITPTITKTKETSNTIINKPNPQTNNHQQNN